MHQIDIFTFSTMFWCFVVFWEGVQTTFSRISPKSLEMRISLFHTKVLFGKDLKLCFYASNSYFEFFDHFLVFLCFWEGLKPPFLGFCQNGRKNKFLVKNIFVSYPKPQILLFMTQNHIFNRF